MLLWNAEEVRRCNSLNVILIPGAGLRKRRSNFNSNAGSAFKGKHEGLVEIVANLLWLCWLKKANKHFACRLTCQKLNIAALQTRLNKPVLLETL